MTDTWKWIIAMAIPILLALGNNYWVSSTSQAAVLQRVSRVEADVREIHILNKIQTDSINSNTIDIHDVSTGWTNVSKAVEANTLQLSKFTEVLIRMEEREKLKDGIK